MMLRRAGVAVFFGLMAIQGMTACKGDESGGGGSGGTANTPIVLPPSNGQSCQTGSSTCDDQAAIDAYSTCIVDTCDAEYKQCFGESYESGTFGGACKGLMECSRECESCDQACLQACSNQHFEGACKECITGPIASCAVSAISSGTCKLPCVSTGGSGGACEELEACCNSFDADEKMSCLTQYAQVKIGGDFGCSAALNTFKSGGLCL